MKNAAYLKGLQNTEEWQFPFWNIFFLQYFTILVAHFMMFSWLWCK